MAKEYSIMIVETDLDLSLDELCASCEVTPDFISELIEHGIIEPKIYSKEDWRFDTTQLSRLRRLVRLQHDLDINLPGAALAIELLEQIEELRAKAELLEKYLHSSPK